MLMDQYYGAAVQDESEKRDTGKKEEEEEEEKKEEEGAEVLLKARSYFAVLNYCVGHDTETSKYSFLMLC
jgi:hypothetical protein